MKKEYTWLIRNPKAEDKYRGEYIAIIDDRIVAHGKDFKRVFAEAKKQGDSPLFRKVPRADIARVI